MAEKESLIGRKFNNWLVLEEVTNVYKDNQRHWKIQCQCDLETERVVTTNRLFRKDFSKDCGCGFIRKKKEQFIGKQFGNVIVLGLHEIKFDGRINRFYWECECQCENKTKIVRSSFTLLKGNPMCENCFKKVMRTKVRESNIKYSNKVPEIYKLWNSIKWRCNSKRNSKHYKDRGIVMCDEWLGDYAKFQDWALSNGYAKGLTIDRIDCNKGYSPDNCRFTDYTVQARNRTNNVYAFYEGKLLPITQIAEITGEPYPTVYSRYYSKNQLYGQKHNSIPN